MARGSDQAKTAATSAQGISDTAGGNANGLYGTLAPQLMATAANPQGMSPTDMAQTTTAVNQSAGGSNAGAVGMGALKAARTRNAGGSDAAIAESARTGSETAGKGVLATQIANQKLKESQREQALGEMGKLYGTDMGASVDALGQVAKNVDANTQAASQSWDWARYILDPALQAAGNAAKFNVG